MSYPGQFMNNPNADYDVSIPCQYVLIKVIKELTSGHREYQTHDDEPCALEASTQLLMLVMQS
jgi:hypothetical protein